MEVRFLHICLCNAELDASCSQRFSFGEVAMGWYVVTEQKAEFCFFAVYCFIVK